MEDPGVPGSMPPLNGDGPRLGDVTFGKRDSDEESTAAATPQVGTEQPEARTDDAAVFLAEFHGDQSRHLVAITPDGGVEGRTFLPDQHDAMRRWIDARQGKKGLYFHVARLRQKPAKPQALKGEVAETEWLHTDVDEAGADALEQLRAHNPPPSVIVASGGGYHGYWRLSEPSADLDRIERCNKALAEKLGGDNCHNINRILRLPGTINLPNARKLEKGRTPTLAHLVEADWSKTYLLDQFVEVEVASGSDAEIGPIPDEVAGVDVEELPASLGEATLTLIRDGDDLARPIGSVEARYPSRSEVVFRVVCDLVRAGCDDATVAGVLTNSRNGISASILEKRRPIQEAYRQIAHARKKQPSPDDLLTQLNEEFCVVRDGGKVRVLSFDLEVQKRAGHEVHRRWVPELMSFQDFHNFHSNRFVQFEEKTMPAGVWWTKHPRRLTYAGLTFQPTAAKVIDGRLNLWRGWGVEPKEGDWSLMRRHISEVLAAGDAETECYLTNWAAWAVQNPAEQAEVAIVLRGGRGGGKGALGRAMCRIFGQHATHISSARHLAGTFNAHLRDACLLFADEAYWPGDKAAEGSLKRLITEPTLFIEAKYKDGRNHPNMLHVIMASNEDWVVPAGEHERRYAVFRISDHKMQDESWFKPLFAQMDNGGYAAMLHDLLHIDLGDWHPRRIPRTAALVEQQSLSLRPEDAAWVGLLEAGVLWGADPKFPSRAVSNDYDEEVEHGDYTRTVKRKGLFDQIRSIVPRIRNEHENKLRHILKKHGATPARPMRKRGWELPPLGEARAKWEERFPDWEWAEPNLTDWQPPEEFDDEELAEREQRQADREQRREIDKNAEFLAARSQDPVRHHEKTEKWRAAQKTKEASSG